MFPNRKTVAKHVSNPDRFRGTAQHWMIDAGPMAGTMLDIAFHDDGSVTWREVAGVRQGESGRARQFHAEAVTGDLYLLSFSTAPGVMLTVTVDFSTRHLVGFRAGADNRIVVRGSFRTL
jgi:hypothetical protein